MALSSQTSLLISTVFLTLSLAFFSFCASTYSPYPTLSGVHKDSALITVSSSAAPFLAFLSLFPAKAVSSTTSATTSTVAVVASALTSAVTVASTLAPSTGVSVFLFKASE